MSYLCIYFEAHQPRRLRKRPSLATPFDDDLNAEILNKVADKCYLPANEMFGELTLRYPEFRICLSVTGTLLEQARRFRPDVVRSFQELGRIARETGRIEFLAETYYHSLSGLFRDGNKEEFRHQIQLHVRLMEEVLGVKPTSFRNTELLFNNSIAAVAASKGFRAILCERRPDMIAGHSPNAVFVDKLKKIKVLPRNDGLSDELAFRFSHRHITAEDFAEWVAMIDGEAVLVGMDYEAIGEHQWRDTGIFDFFKHLPEALARRPNVLCRNPTEIAEAVHDGPVADVDDLATSSWADAGRDTNAWLGNSAQQDLLFRYQEIERRVKSAGDENLISTWRHLGTSDHYYYMCTTRHGSDGGVHQYFSHFDDPPQAIEAYTTVLTQLETELTGPVRKFHLRRKARRPRILLVTPEITELPPGFGNLANLIRAKGGGLADISAALVAEMIRFGLDIHIALPRYERQMLENASISQRELDHLMSLFHNTEPIHLVQDSAFANLQHVYEHTPWNTALHRAEAFQRTVINQVLSEAMPEHGKMLVHCNDWMTGLIPAAAKVRGLPSLFTVHNIYTDKDTLRNIEACGIDVSRFWHELYLEQHPDFVPNPWETVGVDFLLSGIKAASHVNTVSPSFLQEIVNGYFPDVISLALRREIRAKYDVGAASGILNAPRSDVDPRVARGLVRNYDDKTVMEGKRDNKLAFQRRMGLTENPDAALFFWPHRIYSQKGPGLLAEIALPIVHHYWDECLEIAIVGNGDPYWEDAFGAISCGSGGRIAYQHFDPDLSELGKAAADFIVMPSLYEPCGLPQMEGMRYGTLPVVRATGGLKDTVQPLSEDGTSGNGFVFNDFVPDALWWGMSEAMRFHLRPREWKEMVIRRVMRESRERFNLENTTREYIRIYEELLGEKLL